MPKSLADAKLILQAATDWIATQTDVIRLVVQHNTDSASVNIYVTVSGINYFDIVMVAINYDGTADQVSKLLTDTANKITGRPQA